MKPTYDAERVAVAINEAATILERDGWCRNAAHDSHGRSCILGALSEAVGFDGDAVEFLAMNALTNQISADYGKRRNGTLRSIAGWNDNQRDKRKVIRLMRRTARNVLGGKVSYLTGPFSKRKQ